MTLLINFICEHPGNLCCMSRDVKKQYCCYDYNKQQTKVRQGVYLDNMIKKGGILRKQCQQYSDAHKLCVLYCLLNIWIHIYWQDHKET